MRVLMFGWEFPPHIAGGLGTACEGIVKGLAYNGVETLFVMPSASGDEDQSATTIINASDVAVDTVSETVEEYLDKVKFIHIGTNMVPYADPEEFARLVDEDRKRQVKDFSVSYGQKYKFSGKSPTSSGPSARSGGNSPTSAPTRRPSPTRNATTRRLLEIKH